MPTPSRFLKGLYLVSSGTFVLFFGFAYLSIQNCSNIGGNHDALHSARMYQLIVMLAARERPSREFVFSQATPSELDELERISRDSGVPRSFLVSTEPIRMGLQQPPRITIVCGRSFQNVPRRMIMPTPPTHAVAYSDGTTGLISAEEFAKLDRSSFEPLEAILTRAGR